jgi:haloalkane dehalogenase
MSERPTSSRNGATAMIALSDRDASDLFRREPDRFLDVGAGEAAHRCVGTGPDVLFLHGWPVSSATFRLLLPHLVDHVTCHLVDFPSAGWSRFDADTPVSIAHHIVSTRRVVDVLGFDDVAIVGHDSGGMIARHAMVGDPRLRALCLIDSELADPGWRFRSLVAARHLPGLAAGLGLVAGSRRIRRSRLVFGDAFADPTLLDGDFDEFFLQPLRASAARRDAAAAVLRSFDMRLVTELAAIHPQIGVPVQLVWGAEDRFFPVDRARSMVDEFPDAHLTVIERAGLFAHEERPEDVARAMLPTLIGTRRPVSPAEPSE